MNTYYYAWLALDLANERLREAEEYRRLRIARDGQSERPSAIRRGLARATAAISIGAAAATRRLDECVAEDLGRSLALAD